MSKEKVLMMFTVRQKTVLEKAVRYNAENIAGDNKRIYRNDLIQSYIDSSVNDSRYLKVDANNVQDLVYMLLENYAKLTGEEM